MSHQYEAQLLTNLARITKDLAVIATHNQTTDDWEAIPDSETKFEADVNSEADGVESWNERRAIVASLETEYRDIKRALAKITAGTFGRCEICQEPISEARLDAKPSARTCVAHLSDETQLTL